MSRHPRSAVAVALLLPVVLALTACSTSVRPVSPASYQELAFPAAQAAPAPADVPALLARGDRLLATGQPQLAAGCYLKVLEQAPQNRHAGSGLGTALLDQGETTRARQVFARLLNDHPGDLAATIGLARACRLGSQPGRAIELLEASREQGQSDPLLLTELAHAYQAGEQPAAADPLYREVAARLPGQAAAANNLGYNLILLGRYDEAVASLGGGRRPGTA